MAYHTPVLPEACIKGLEINPDGIYVDLTMGGGGHTRAILNQLSAKGKVFAFDQDPEAGQNVPEDERVIFIRQNFRFFINYLRYYGISGVDGILADLGVSSHHFEGSARGFSFRQDEPLDMRMDTDQKLTAAFVLNEYDPHSLVQIFKRYGEIKNAYSLAKTIESARMEKPIKTIGQFLELIDPLLPVKTRNKQLARIFQALRIEVNQEIEQLKKMLLLVPHCLKKGGRLVVLSYHSLEDRIVKNFIKTGDPEGRFEKDLYGNFEAPMVPVNRKVITPDEEEIKRNSRARSARLRIAQKN